MNGYLHYSKEENGDRLTSKKGLVRRFAVTLLEGHPVKVRITGKCYDSGWLSGLLSTGAVEWFVLARSGQPYLAKTYVP